MSFLSSSFTCTHLLPKYIRFCFCSRFLPVSFCSGFLENTWSRWYIKSPCSPALSCSAGGLAGLRYSGTVKSERNLLNIYLGQMNFPSRILCIINIFACMMYMSVALFSPPPSRPILLYYSASSFSRLSISSRVSPHEPGPAHCFLFGG